MPFEAFSFVVAMATAEATPPPEIIHTITSVQCDELRASAIPIGYIAKRNDAAVAAMGDAAVDFLKYADPGFVAQSADISAALAQPIDYGAMYGPKQTIDAARMDQVAQQIYKNIVLEDGYMNESWKDVGDGKNAQVDDLRQHLQNLIDLQRAVADRYEAFAGLYLSSKGSPKEQNVTTLKMLAGQLEALLIGSVSNVHGTAKANLAAYDSVHDIAEQGNPTEVLQALAAEERSYAGTFLTTYNHCNGTTYILKPQPSPSP